MLRFIENLKIKKEVLSIKHFVTSGERIKGDYLWIRITQNDNIKSNKYKQEGKAFSYLPPPDLLSIRLIKNFSFTYTCVDYIFIHPCFNKVYVFRFGTWILFEGMHPSFGKTLL